MLIRLLAFYCGGAVACLLLTRNIRKISNSFLFSLTWPASIPYGMWLARRHS